MLQLSLPRAADAPSAPRPTAAGPGRGVSFWRAAARIASADSPASRFRHRAKFLLRSWCRPRLTRAWLARLLRPDLAPLWALHPRLATKLQRPYVSREWTVPVRCAALVGHYDVLPRLLAPAVLAAIYADGADVLELVNPPTGRRLRVRLLYQDQFEKEGELTLTIVDGATGLTLAGLTFCLVRDAGRLSAIIGGLQAQPDPRTRGLIHEVAKEMCGLRPKAFALWCLQQLAARWGIEQIRAVGDRQHICRHWRKPREIAASYDQFWSECDGRRLPGGGWELPLQLRPRTRAELKPTRRKLHEQRYALLQALRPALLAAVANLAPGGAAPGGPGATPAFVFPVPAAAPRAQPAVPAPKFALPPASTQPNHSF
ncbi:MAG: DUF535 family protein [Opitutae bacterium]|nr:DUF535 family protein [Opitutae bacterium]